VAYHPEAEDEGEFNKALGKLWLYGSRSVALKMDYAISIMIKGSRGNITTALQEAVVEMRKDIQLPYVRRVKPQEVKHIYSRIASIDLPTDLKGKTETR
jgi:hypothetical protein